MKAIQTIASLLFLGLFAWMGWLLLSAFITSIGSADSTVVAAIVAGLFAFGGALFAFWKERSRTIREAHRARKIEIYQQFIDLIFEMVRRKVAGAGGDVGYMQQPEFQHRMIDFKMGLLVYGAPEVIKAYVDFQKGSQHTEGTNIEVLAKVEKLLLAIRKDIGLSNFALKPGDLHRLYVTDYPDQLPGTRR